MSRVQIWIPEPAPAWMRGSAPNLASDQPDLIFGHGAYATKMHSFVRWSKTK